MPGWQRPPGGGWFPHVLMCIGGTKIDEVVHALLDHVKCCHSLVESFHDQSRLRLAVQGSIAIPLLTPLKIASQSENVFQV